MVQHHSQHPAQLLGLRDLLTLYDDLGWGGISDLELLHHVDDGLDDAVIVASLLSDALVRLDLIPDVSTRGGFSDLHDSSPDDIHAPAKPLLVSGS